MKRVVNKMQFKNKKNTNYVMLPFKGLLIYIITTLILSFVGPVKYQYYNLSNKLIVFIYITLFLLITYIGMVSNASYKPNRILIADGKWENKIIKHMSYCIILEFAIKLMLVISSIKLTGLPNMENISIMLAKVYSNLHYSEVTFNIFRKIDTFATFLFYIALFGGFYIRKKLKSAIRIILYSILILDLFYNIAFIGTIRSIFTYFILVLMLYITNVVKEKRKIHFKSFFKAFILISVAIVVVMNLLSARQTYWGSNTDKIEFLNGISYNLNNSLLIFIPKNLRYQITNVVSYLTQGYYGLSLCLTMPFEWTYGLGSLRGINTIISEVFPFVPNMTMYTYPVRAEAIYGYQGLANWHTIFSWLASDMTFIGALFFMGIVGKIYVKCWKQVIDYNNIISFVLMVLLTIQYIFVPANNQLYINRGEALATIIIFIVWIFNNKKYNFKDSSNE